MTKLTGKYQTSVPAPVRRILDLHAGDSVVFEVAGGRVSLRKALPMDVEYLRALETTLCEWVSDNDEEAYRGL